jgi:hypothetical protein
MKHQVVNVTEFKANCLTLLDGIGERGSTAQSQNAAGRSPAWDRCGGPHGSLRKAHGPEK